MKCGRKGSVFSVQPGKFSDALKTWWYNLQPNQRGEDGQCRPETPIPLASWDLLAKSGRNGVFLVILALSWWRHAIAKLPDDESRSLSIQDWERLVYDVDWVLNSINSSRGATTSTNIPSNSPEQIRGTQLKRRAAGSENPAERRKRSRR